MLRRAQEAATPTVKKADLEVDELRGTDPATGARACGGSCSQVISGRTRKVARTVLPVESGSSGCACGVERISRRSRYGVHNRYCLVEHHYAAHNLVVAVIVSDSTTH